MQKIKYFIDFSLLLGEGVKELLFRVHMYILSYDPPPTDPTHRQKKSIISFL